MSNKLSHQKAWKKSVYDVYKDASLKLEWTKTKLECDKVNIDFFTAPYSLELVNFVNKYICAYKVVQVIIPIESIQRMAKKINL